jgi:hypothetical protein
MPPLPSCVPASVRDGIPDERAHLKSSRPRQAVPLLLLTIVALVLDVSYYSTTALYIARVQSDLGLESHITNSRRTLCTQLRFAFLY